MIDASNATYRYVFNSVIIHLNHVETRFYRLLHNDPMFRCEQFFIGSTPVTLTSTRQDPSPYRHKPTLITRPYTCWRCHKTKLVLLQTLTNSVNCRFTDNGTRSGDISYDTVAESIGLRANGTPSYNIIVIPTQA